MRDTGLSSNYEEYGPLLEFHTRVEGKWTRESVIRCIIFLMLEVILLAIQANLPDEFFRFLNHNEVFYIPFFVIHAMPLIISMKLELGSSRTKKTVKKTPKYYHCEYCGGNFNKFHSSCPNCGALLKGDLL